MIATLQNIRRSAQFWLLLTASFLLFYACNTDSAQPVQKQDSANRTLRAGKNGGGAADFAAYDLYGFSYPADSFFALFRDPDMQRATAKLILRIYSDNLFDFNVQFKLMGNATKTHGDHGADKPNPIIFPLLQNVSIQTEENQRYIFGNSEVNLKAMRDLVERGGQRLPNFDHFVFEPKVDTATRAVVYRIYPADAQGNKVSFSQQQPGQQNVGKTAVTELESNPSPPRRPVS
jgi:hypothetical protein